MKKLKNASSGWKAVIIIVFLYIALTFIGDMLFGLKGCSSSNTNKSVSSSENYKSEPSKLMEWPVTLKEGEKLAEDYLEKNFYIIFDDSGSMFETRCAQGATKESIAKFALLKFAEKIPKDANIGLLVFDQTGVRERVSLGKNNIEAFKNEVKRSVAGSGTPLKTAMEVGVKKLGVQAGKQLGYGEYNLIVVTDGEANTGEEPDRIVDFTVNHTPIVIHTIGFCIDEGHSLNRPDEILYKRALKPEDLTKGLDAVLAESETFDISKFK